MVRNNYYSTYLLWGFRVRDLFEIGMEKTKLQSTVRLSTDTYFLFFDSGVITTKIIIPPDPLTSVRSTYTEGAHQEGAHSSAPGRGGFGVAGQVFDSENINATSALPSVTHGNNNRTSTGSDPFGLSDGVEHELSKFWLRKTKKPVLCVLMVQKSPTHEPVFFRGLNIEVSMPTGSLCAERNCIGSAIASDPTIMRQHIKMIAVLSMPSLDSSGPTWTDRTNEAFGSMSAMATGTSKQQNTNRNLSRMNTNTSEFDDGMVCPVAPKRLDVGGKEAFSPVRWMEQEEI
jgi:hypothetical protein